MKVSDAVDKVVRFESCKGADYKQAMCDYVRRACLAVADRAEDYVPDGAYVYNPGEITIRLPLGGDLATVEVDAEMFVVAK